MLYRFYNINSLSINIHIIFTHRYHIHQLYVFFSTVARNVALRFDPIVAFEAINSNWINVPEAWVHRRSRKGFIGRKWAVPIVMGYPK